jgi:hypothetical protein
MSNPYDDTVYQFQCVILVWKSMIRYTDLQACDAVGSRRQRGAPRFISRLPLNSFLNFTTS